VQGDVPSLGKLRMLLSGGNVYAQLPPALNPSGKPWVHVTAGSKNAIVGQLSGVLTQIQAAASLTSLATLAGATSKITDKGSETVGGVSAKHYSLIVDASKLPDSFPGKSDLANAPLKGKPVELWLD